MSAANDKYTAFQLEVEDLARRINPLRTDQPQVDIQETLYSRLEGDTASQVMAFGLSRSACEAYERTYGQKPSVWQLATAAKAIENIMEGRVGENVGTGQLILEADETSTADIPVRNIFLGLILPATLMSITSRLTTPFPSNPDKADIFKLHVRAASNWQGYAIGDEITEDFRGGYGNMDVYHSFGSGGGTSFNATTGYNLVRERVNVLVDMTPVAKDDGNGNISGTADVNGTTLSVVGSTVDYTTGAISLTFSSAVPAGLEVEVKVDVDIEANPDLIPKIKYDVSKYEVYPHESVLGAQYTLQSMLNLSRSYGQNMANIASRSLLNLITANNDRIIIRDMYKGAIGMKVFDAALPTGLAVDQHYPTISFLLEEMSQELVARNKKAGLFALVCGQTAARFFKAQGRMGMFTAAPNYRNVPQPHFCGRYGNIEIYEDPQLPSNEAVGIAKADDYFRCGFYSSIAVPYMPFKHSVMEDLRYKSTLYGKQFRDFSPHDGRNYFMRLQINNF